VQRHAWGTAKAAGISSNDILKQFADGQAHIFIGSPPSSDSAEAVVAAAHNVPSFSPNLFWRAFPYVILWPRFRKVPSTWGWTSTEGRYGIVLTKTAKIVARRTSIEFGLGDDAGLILVLRLAVTDPTCARREGLIIVLSGVSGPGTLACARVLLHQAFAARELYPTEVGVPLMRAVAASYKRPQADNTCDNRVLFDWRLVTRQEEENATESVPDLLPANGQTDADEGGGENASPA
jgi:hypothetical protein